MIYESYPTEGGGKKKKKKKRKVARWEYGKRIEKKKEYVSEMIYTMHLRGLGEPLHFVNL